MDIGGESDRCRWPEGAAGRRPVPAAESLGAGVLGMCVRAGGSAQGVWAADAAVAGGRGRSGLAPKVGTVLSVLSGQGLSCAEQLEEPAGCGGGVAAAEGPLRPRPGPAERR